VIENDDRARQAADEDRQEHDDRRLVGTEGSKNFLDSDFGA
jgi:hypothetical protein